VSDAAILFNSSGLHMQETDTLLINRTMLVVKALNIT
jgi:hypothetical protein